MKLSQGWEQSVYTLLILSCLPEGKSMNSQTIAERLQVSSSYLKKIIKLLVNEGLVHSVPGKNGGFSLARQLENITFLDVFLAIEGRGRIFYSQRLLINFLGLPVDHGENCRISAAMNYLEETLMSTLAMTTLDKMMRETEKNYDLTNLTDWIDEQNQQK